MNITALFDLFLLVHFSLAYINEKSDEKKVNQNRKESGLNVNVCYWTIGMLRESDIVQFSLYF